MKEARKITRKCMKEIEDFKTEAKRIKKVYKEIVRYKTSKLLWFKYWKRIDNGKNEKIEANLEKLKIPK